MTPSVILQSDSRGLARVTLNRPDIHNAFDDVLIADLTRTLKKLGGDDHVRAVVLSGAGDSFSAGADLNWMRRMVDTSEQENLADALALAELMRTLNFLDKPTIARVNGAAFGGGVGLIACCDIAIAADSARFGLTEARLGLVPAVISPYVVAAMGERQARRLFTSAATFGAAEACRLGLVHETQPSEDLDAAIDKEIERLLRTGPQALRAAKSLVAAVAGKTEESQRRLDEATAKLIARLRVSPEGREGVSAFLEKRDASWTRED